MGKDFFTDCVNGALQPGDLVISTPDDDYACLVGTVLEINKLGTPEHDTENDTDDVHVNFFDADYSDRRAKEIEAMFSDLYGEPKEFGDCPLDYAIMPPDCLIRITGIEQESLVELLDSEGAATAFCGSVLRVRELTDRLSQNLSDYRDSLLTLDKEEIISDAGMIAAVSDTHYYLTESHDFEDSEVDYLLLFENPLALVAEKWCDRTAQMDDFPFALNEVFGKKDALDSSHRLYEKPIPPAPGQEKPMGMRQAARYEATRLLAELKSIRTPNHPNKMEYMAKVSPDFLRQAGGDWLKPLTALTDVIRPPLTVSLGHFGQGNDMYIAVGLKARDSLKVIKPPIREQLREAADKATAPDAQTRPEQRRKREGETL